MPYILPTNREDYDKHIKQLLKEVKTNYPADRQVPGEINYIITKILLEYLQGRNCHYSDLNEIMGILESVKQEFYRRVVAPYEEKKTKENGDVYQ